MRIWFEATMINWSWKLVISSRQFPVTNLVNQTISILLGLNDRLWKTSNTFEFERLRLRSYSTTKAFHSADASAGFVIRNQSNQSNQSIRSSSSPSVRSMNSISRKFSVCFLFCVLHPTASTSRFYWPVGSTDQQVPLEPLNFQLESFELFGANKVW